MIPPIERTYDMFSLILSFSLSIILNALNFQVLAPLQAIFIADMGKQVVMDQVDTIEIGEDIDDLFQDFHDFFDGLEL
jgi:hypothetical protein